MPKPLRTIIVLLLELVVFVTVVLTILTGALLWRLQQGAVPVDFVKPILVNRVHARDPTLDLAIGSVSLTWPDWQKPLVLEISQLEVKQKGESRLALSTAAVSIARLPLLIGQIQPVAAILRDPDIRLIQTADGGLIMMNAAAGKPRRAASNDERIRLDGLVAAIRGFALNEAPPKDKARSFWADFLREFEAIRVEHAALYFEDDTQTVNWALPDVTLEFAREDGQLKGVLTSRTKYNPMTVVSLSALPDDKGGLSLSARIKDFALIAPLRDMIADAVHADFSISQTDFDARLDLSLTETGSITHAKGAFSTPATTITMPDNLDVPLTMADATLDFDYAVRGAGENRSGKLKLETAEMTLNGIALAVSGELDIEGLFISGPIRLSVPEISLDALQALWPDNARDNTAGDWLTQRLTNGTVRNLSFAARLEAAEADLWEDFDDPDSWWLDTALPLGPTWDWSLSDSAASFSFTGLDVDYNSPMVPALGTEGTGSYKDQTLLLNVAKGRINDLDIVNGIVQIDGVESGENGMAHITVPIKGPLQTLVDYVMREPISLDPTLVGDVKQITGTVDATVLVEFPTLDDLHLQDVTVTTEGKATGVTWPDIVRKLPLREGAITIGYKDNAVTVSGKGLLDDAPVDFTWSRKMNEEAPGAINTNLTAKLAANGAMRSKLGFPLPDEVTGDTPLDVTYTKTVGGRGEMDIAADLTQARILIDALGYTKPVGIQASGSGQLVMNNSDLTQIRKLSLKLPDGRLEGGTLDFNTLKGETNLTGGTLTRVVLPAHDFNMRFTHSPADLYDMQIVATKFDATPILDSAPVPTDAAPTPVAAATRAQAPSTKSYKIGLSAATLRTSANGGLTDARVAIATVPGGDVSYLKVEGNASGKVSMVFDPKAQPAPLMLDAENAGAFLRNMAIYDNIVGGTLTLRGKPIGGNTMANMDGQMELRDFTVVKAPALARLLNAMSLTGILQVLDSKGIAFKRLQAGFAWVEDTKGKRINVLGGRTSGASLGLTFDGMFDREKKLLDLNGTIIPVSEVNKIISKIPLIRDILLGGKNGSLIAATYTMKGPAADPNVSINPLSVLTPGIIRKILFEQDNDKENARQPAPQTTPPAQTPPAASTAKNG